MPSEYGDIDEFYNLSIGVPVKSEGDRVLDWIEEQAAQGLVLTGVRGKHKDEPVFTRVPSPPSDPILDQARRTFSLRFHAYQRLQCLRVDALLRQLVDAGVTPDQLAEHFTLRIVNAAPWGVRPWFYQIEYSYGPYHRQA